LGGNPRKREHFHSRKIPSFKTTQRAKRILMKTYSNSNAIKTYKRNNMFLIKSQPKGKKEKDKSLLGEVCNKN
jgi:hypothetical protein